MPLAMRELPVVEPDMDMGVRDREEDVKNHFFENFVINCMLQRIAKTAYAAMLITG